MIYVSGVLRVLPPRSTFVATEQPGPAVDVRSFRGAAAAWLSTVREQRARLLMQLAYVASAEAEERFAPPELDEHGRPVRDAIGAPYTREPSDDELRQAEALREESDALASAARRCCGRIVGLDSAMVEVHERARVQRVENEHRSTVERLLADYIYDGPGGHAGVLVGQRHAVGRYRAPGSTGATYACLDRDGAPVAARGAPVEATLVDQEWSASRAAAIFVAQEGVAFTERTLRLAIDDDDNHEHDHGVRHV